MVYKVTSLFHLEQVCNHFKADLDSAQLVAQLLATKHLHSTEQSEQTRSVKQILTAVGESPMKKMIPQVVT